MLEEKEITIKKRRPIRAFFKSFVNVRKWSSYDEVSADAKMTFGLFRKFFSRNTARVIKQETYEESVARLHMTEEQLLQRKKVFLYSALIYGGLAFILFVYFVYLLLTKHFLATFLALILTGLMIVSAYREHFWYMQMQKRKLGCSFSDWLAFVLRRTR